MYDVDLNLKIGRGAKGEKGRLGKLISSNSMIL